MMPWSLWRSRRPLEPWPCWPKLPGLPCGCAKWAGLWAAHLCSYKRGGEELSERCKVDGELRGWGGGLISILLGFCISWVRLARKSASFAAFTRNLTRCRLNERIRLECFLWIAENFPQIWQRRTKDSAHQIIWVWVQLPGVQTWFPRWWSRQKLDRKLLRDGGTCGAHGTRDLTLAAWRGGQRQRVFCPIVRSGSSLWGQPVPRQNAGQVIVGQRWRRRVGGGARDRTAPAVTPIEFQVLAGRLQGGAGVPYGDSTQSWGGRGVCPPEQNWWRGGGDGTLYSSPCHVPMMMLVGIRGVIGESGITLRVSVLCHQSTEAFSWGWHQRRGQPPAIVCGRGTFPRWRF